LRQIKIILEKHPDGYVTYLPGFKGVVVGKGEHFEEVLADFGVTVDGGVGFAVRGHCGGD